MKSNKLIELGIKGLVPIRKTFKMECCDCGLVHQWTFTKKDGDMGYLVSRDNRATAQRRKRLVMLMCNEDRPSELVKVLLRSGKSHKSKKTWKDWPKDPGENTKY